MPGGSTPGPFAEANGLRQQPGHSEPWAQHCLSETHVFSPTMVNQVTGGYNRIFNYITSTGRAAASPRNSAFLAPTIGTAGTGNSCAGHAVAASFRSHLSAGFWGLGDRGFAPFQGGTNVFSIADSFDMIMWQARHQDGRLGFRANQMNVRSHRLPGRLLESSSWICGPNFNPIADLLMGLSSFASTTRTSTAT